MILRICSLFAGAGGIDFAFHQAGFKTVWANEFDKEACMTYKLNFPDTPLSESDIRIVPATDIPDFDVLVAGFPCQPFSKLGMQKGFEDDRGNLFFEICRIIDAKKPRAVFLENVANLVTHDNGNTFNVIQKEIRQRGYSFNHIVADACDYGFPQHRTRTYMVCFDDQQAADRFCFPEKSELLIHTWDIIDHSGKGEEKRYLSPDHPRYAELSRSIRNSRLIYRFSDEGVVTGYNGICFTLLAGMGNWHDREPIIKDAGGIRKLSPAECFRLMGYPDSFRLDGIPEKGAYRQAGNSVCVPVVKQIAEEIRQVFEIEEQESVLELGSENDTLVGVLRSRNQLKVCLEGQFYYFPKSRAPEHIDNLRYIALNLTPRVFGSESGIRYIGRIQDNTVLPRYMITEIPKNSDEDYHRMTIEKWEELPAGIPSPHSSVLFTCRSSKIIPKD